MELEHWVLWLLILGRCAQLSQLGWVKYPKVKKVPVVTGKTYSCQSPVSLISCRTCHSWDSCTRNSTSFLKCNQALRRPFSVTMSAPAMLRWVRVSQRGVGPVRVVWKYWGHLPCSGRERGVPARAGEVECGAPHSQKIPLSVTWLPDTWSFCSWWQVWET